MTIIAICNSLSEAQRVRSDLQQHGIGASIIEENLASWRIPRVSEAAIGIHVTVSSCDRKKAEKFVSDHFPHLAPIREEALCPACESSGLPPQPFNISFLRSLWMIVKVRMFGRVFCPACHRTWKPVSNLTSSHSEP